MDENLKRMEAPPNPWFAQRVINNAFLAERPLPFWQALWRDLNAELPVPQPVVAMVLVLLCGFVFGLTDNGQDAETEMLYSQNLLYESGGAM